VLVRIKMRTLQTVRREQVLQFRELSGQFRRYLLPGVLAVATGQEPPNPEDPDVPTLKAVTWFVSSGVGVGLIQLFLGRHLARRRIIRQITDQD
jgi:hypothetical protein